MSAGKVIFLLLFVAVHGHVLDWRPPNIWAIDPDLHEEVIDPELCDQQIQFIMGNTFLALQFADAGIRTPRGVLTGNMLDMGNYHQCLGISQRMEGSQIQGKYCTIRFPLRNLELPTWPNALHGDFDLSALRVSNETADILEQMNIMMAGAKSMTGVVDERLMPGNPLAMLTFNLAVCIPKPCTTNQALTSALFNLTQIGLQYEDSFCRLPDDKPWSGADYAMVVVIGVFGVLTLISTCYDLYYRFINNNESNKANPNGTIFSLYTNGRRLMTFTSGRDSIECVDGIRALAMIWVLIGHTFTSVPFWSNPMAGWQWVPTINALWITSAPITVDTFFALSGMLVVFTTAGKLNGKQLVKNIHVFYLNRLLRMFPILAMTVLYEASYMNRVTDGPVWTTVERHVNTCRSFWWPTLLHLQNYLNPEFSCIGQSWYLAIDVQLHILSPIVLFFVLSGKKNVAWIALAAANIIMLIAATSYNFYMEFPTSMMSAGRGHEAMHYLVYYYVNTLTRAAPFLVGMIVGYILHLYRDTRIRCNRMLATCILLCALAVKLCVLFSVYPSLRTGWDNQTLDSLFNSFIRPIWAAALGVMIIACHHGYGGPVNWLLSWQIWKLPARISYAMYLVHFALMLNVTNAVIVPILFSMHNIIFSFLGHFGITFVVSFLVTLIIDAPFSTIFKKLLEQPKKKQPQSTIVNDIPKENEKQM